MCIRSVPDRGSVPRADATSFKKLKPPEMDHDQAIRLASMLIGIAWLVPVLASEPAGSAGRPGRARYGSDCWLKRPTKARRARPQRVFVPMDFKRMFTAGPLSDSTAAEHSPAGRRGHGRSHASCAATPTVCRYSVGKDLPFDQMTPFDTTGSVVLAPHRHPWTRSRSDSTSTTFTSAPPRIPRLPSTSNTAACRRPSPGSPARRISGAPGISSPQRKEHAARIDLWLGVHFSVDQIRRLRQLNPNCLVLTDINTVENNDVPDEYFLRDTTGRKIEVWPGAYRLNLTRPEVAEYQARYAYQRMIESRLMYDGCFFDNFMTSQSWQTHDIYDRPVQLDGDGDGKPDPKDVFDKAWRQGVFHELREWRKLMPWALTTGHSQGYPNPEIAEIFNGQGIGFYTTDVIEGKKSFHELWDYYNAWCTVTVKPAITSVESAVPDQIAYGYDYTPQRHMPPSTWSFARDYYPYMRFGLAFTLMNDGYFSHELGDTDHGQDWWYDELDHKLGAPLGPARPVAVSRAPDRELMANGGFESELDDTWSLWFDRSSRLRRDGRARHARPSRGNGRGQDHRSRTPAEGAESSSPRPRRSLERGQRLRAEILGTGRSPHGNRLHRLERLAWLGQLRTRARTSG